MTCAAGKGPMIDYVIIAKGFRILIHSCEVVRTVACGALM